MANKIVKALTATRINTTHAQDVVILQSVGIAAATTLGSIARKEGVKPKALLAAGLLAAGLSAVAVVDGEVAVGLGTIALVGVVLFTLAGKPIGVQAAEQLTRIGNKIPAPGGTATEAFRRAVESVETQASAPNDAPTGTTPNSSAPVGGGGFAKPILARFSPPGPHSSARNAHHGDAVDILVPKGTPVYAIQAGRIGSQFGMLDPDPSSVLAGIRLHLMTADGNDWYYAHLSRTAPGIGPGSIVTAGQLLGYTGVANNTAHLHLEDLRQTVRSRI